MPYKRNETLLLQYLGPSPVLRMIDFFLDNPLSDYSKNEIAKRLEMSRVTFFKYWAELEKSGAVKITRKIGRATLYKLNDKNEIIKHLVKLDMALARGAMQKTSERYKKPVIVKSR